MLLEEGYVPKESGPPRRKRRSLHPQACLQICIIHPQPYTLQKQNKDRMRSNLVLGVGSGSMSLCPFALPQRSRLQPKYHVLSKHEMPGTRWAQYDPPVYRVHGPFQGPWSDGNGLDLQSTNSHCGYPKMKGILPTINWVVGRWTGGMLSDYWPPNGSEGRPVATRVN